MSDFKVIRMKDGESVDNFFMKLTSIVLGICSLGNEVEESSSSRSSSELSPKIHANCYLYRVVQRP